MNGNPKTSTKRRKNVWFYLYLQVQPVNHGDKLGFTS
uniref:Uncharacterized protein n=1 Tax=Anguilla anguilla TaxID=7936 RepID=A0A0E9SNQ6_ANGAN